MDEVVSQCTKTKEPAGTIQNAAPGWASRPRSGVAPLGRSDDFFLEEVVEPAAIDAAHQMADAPQKLWGWQAPNLPPGIHPGRRFPGERRHVNVLLSGESLA